MDKVHDPAKWHAYEAETERRLRQAIGDELYEYLDRLAADPAKEE